MFSASLIASSRSIAAPAVIGSRPRSEAMSYGPKACVRDDIVQVVEMIRVGSYRQKSTTLKARRANNGVIQRNRVLPVLPTDYYDFLPGADHVPGDIWSDLPTFGIIARPHVTGLVITPACDLSNRKVETITYLPVIPVSAYFMSIAFLPELKRNLEGQLQASGLGGLLDTVPPFDRISDESLATIAALIEERQTATTTAAKEKIALSRAGAGLNIVSAVCKADTTSNIVDDLRTLLGPKAFAELTSKIIENSLRLDLHFLPRDEQRIEWSGVDAHSVALFRYPITIPIEILERANAVSSEDWPHLMKTFANILPCAGAFSKRPLKRLRMKPRFLSDLVTRFTAMFGRLGSPDFTRDTIERYAGEIGGGK
jgi:hypothetical protein